MRLASVRRFAAALFIVIFMWQGSGLAIATPMNVSITPFSLAAMMQSLEGTRFGAFFTNDERWKAMHAPRPTFPRETPQPDRIPDRSVNTDRHFNVGVFRTGPHMLDHPIDVKNAPLDPRARNGKELRQTPCTLSVNNTPCAQTAESRRSNSPFPQSPAAGTVLSGAYRTITSSSVAVSAARQRIGTPVIGRSTLSINPSVEPFLYEADTTSAPTTLFYTVGGETGAIGRTMDSAPANAQAQQTVTYASGLTSDSFGWVSPANVPNLTSWPAQTYTVTLNVATPNPNLSLAQVRLYRVDANGGPSTSGLAVVGDLNNLTQSLGTAGPLTFNVSGSAQTASATDRIAVKIRVVNNTSTTQSFSYWAGENSGSGMNLNNAGTLNTSTTGLVPWWTYEGTPLPGAGRYAINVGNGNLVFAATDVDVPERGIDLAFQRVYNVQSQHDASNTDGSTPGNYGDGWTNNFDAHLAYHGANTISVYSGDGARYDYTADGSGHWTPPAGQHAALVWDDSCGYQWTKPNGTVYYFYSPDLNETANCSVPYPQDSAYGGRLYQVWARNHNNSIQLTYAWNNNDASNPSNLSQINVTHSDGQSLVLQFGPAITGGPTELLSIQRPDYSTCGSACVINYYYDTTGENLKWSYRPGNSAASVLRQLYTYTNGHQLQSVGSPRYADNANDGDVTYFLYDSSVRVTKTYGRTLVNFAPADGMSTYLQTPAPASTPLQQWHTMNFSGYGTGTTTMTDTDGHSTIWTVDSALRVTQTEELTGESSPSYLISSTKWDSANNLIESTDVRGNITDYAYDGNGNTIAEASPSVTVSGATFRPTSLYSYDSNNNVLTYCDPVSNHPTRDWNPTTSPTPAPASCPSQTGATRYTWGTSTAEPFGFLTDMYTPAYGSGNGNDPGYHVQILYNTANEGGGDYGLPTTVKGDPITQTIDNTTRTPTQTFTYDAYGNVTQYDKGNGPWRLQYDVMNRLTSSKDPDGYTSYVYYYNNGQTSKTETPYQHARGVGSTFAYDRDGNETQETVYHGGTYVSGALPTLPSPPPPTTKYYDGADRLVEVQQPRDSSNNGEAYTNPWITRYLYDLSQNGTVSPLPTVGGTSVAAHGNLYKTVELAPSTDTVTYTSTSPAVNGQFNDLKGNAFDALDRPTARYYFVVNSSQNGDVLQEEAYAYDSGNVIASNNAGLLSSDCDALNECTYYAYDNDSKIAQTQHTASSTLDRTFGYDADGRTTSVALPTWGSQYYQYDTDGRLTQSIEPSNMDSYATLTYHYYNDGKRSALDVASAKFSQNSLFAYAYRSDGKLETQQINQPGNSLVGTTSLSFTYTNGGRLTRRSEAGPGANSTPTQYIYDASYGHVIEMDYPAGKFTGLEYDPANSSLGWSASGSNILSSSWTYQYSLRGEMLTFAQPQVAGQPYPPINIMANGVALNTQFKSGTLNNASFSATIDPRMGLFLSSTALDTGNNQSDQGVSFDQIGRIASDTSDSIPSCDTCKSKYYATARSYDQDNHVLTTNLQQCNGAPQGSCTPTTYASATYDWGPNAHPIRIGSASAYETLHWDGDQLLFTTNANGLNDIKIGEIGDITPLDPNYKGLTFWDRDVAHSVAFCHNATGSSGDGTPSWTHTNSYGIAYTTSPCKLASGQVMATPANMIWGNQSTTSTVRIGSGGIITMPRADGFNDGFNVINGVRAYDGTIAGWTTPDAYQGQLHDPMSQKSYVWNRDNPVAYNDPTGYSSLFFDASVGDSGPTGEMYVQLDDGQYADAYADSYENHGPRGPIGRMQPSEQGLKFIEQHEGYSGTVYYDSAGNATIGYGHLILPGEDFSNGITQKEADALFRNDLKSAVDSVNASLRVKVSQSQFDALVDFAYNVGGGAFARSTLARNINAGRPVSESNFTAWDRAGGIEVEGLRNRREDEYRLFTTGNYRGP